MPDQGATIASDIPGERVTRLELRRVWVQIHLWLGLTLGILGALIGVTGSLLIYDHAIDGWLNPQRYQTSGVEVGQGYGDYARKAAAVVGEGARPLNVRLPDAPGMPVVVFVRAQGESGGLRRIYLDPPTGRVLDAPRDGGLIGWAHDFHESLKLRDYSGREMVGVVGIAMLISSLSGIYLWLPRRRIARKDFAFRPGLTLSRNLHYTFGIYAALVLAMLSFTGIFLAFPDAGRNSVAAFGPLSPSPRGVQAVAPAEGTPIALDAAVAIAKARYPQAEITSVGLPTGPRGVYRIAMREPGDSNPRPVTQVFVDPHSQAVIRKVDLASQTRGDTFLAYQRPLHDGDFWGSPGRAVLFVVGLLPAMFVVTGTMMWLRTRRLRQERIPGGRRGG
jgi:uncharacterized iron-regulated membrane protein